MKMYIIKKKNPEFSVGCEDEWKSTKMMVNVLL